MQCDGGNTYFMIHSVPCSLDGIIKPIGTLEGINDDKNDEYARRRPLLDWRMKSLVSEFGVRTATRRVSSTVVS